MTALERAQHNEIEEQQRQLAEAAAEIAELRRRATGMEKALRSAHHALTLLHGCVATDRADQVPGMDTDKYKNLVWTVNNHKELTEIEAALTGAKP